MPEPINVTDSLGRVITIQEPDIGDQFDMLEAVGANSSNQAWVGLATLVFTAMSIDGAPIPRPRKKEDFKRNAVMLKNEGVAAIAEYFKNKADDNADAEADVAKN